VESARSAPQLYSEGLKQAPLQLQRPTPHPAELQDEELAAGVLLDALTVLVEGLAVLLVLGEDVVLVTTGEAFVVDLTVHSLP